MTEQKSQESKDTLSNTENSKPAGPACPLRPPLLLMFLLCFHVPFLLPPQMYIMLNIRIVLVGLEIWTDRNPIITIGGAGDVLGNFVQWREKFLIARRRHDSAQLVL